MFQVVVGNIGTVYSGPNEARALIVFQEYQSQSMRGYGRASYESVTLLKDDEVIKYHWSSEGEE